MNILLLLKCIRGKRRATRYLYDLAATINIDKDKYNKYITSIICYGTSLSWHADTKLGLYLREFT